MPLYNPVWYVIPVDPLGRLCRDHKCDQQINHYNSPRFLYFKLDLVTLCSWLRSQRKKTLCAVIELFKSRNVHKCEHNGPWLGCDSARYDYVFDDDDAKASAGKQKSSKKHKKHRSQSPPSDTHRHKHGNSTNPTRDEEKQEKHRHKDDKHHHHRHSRSPGNSKKVK